MDSYISVIARPQTGLFHGAVYRNRPTPSGCDRFLLSEVADEGHLRSRDAAAAASAAFPEAAIDPEKFADIDLGVMSAFPAGSVLTVAIPRDRSGGGASVTEVTLHDGEIIAVALTRESLRALVASGRLAADSSSGDDPELEFRYDHYLLQPPAGDLPVAPDGANAGSWQGSRGPW